jgi:hypothetical protein
MGLQDEKIKPGKVMKANKGKMTPLKKDPTTPVNPFEKRRKQLGGGRSKLPGRIGTALGIDIYVGTCCIWLLLNNTKIINLLRTETKLKLKNILVGGAQVKKFIQTLEQT